MITSHQLAQKLLNGPDLPVVLHQDYDLEVNEIVEYRLFKDSNLVPEKSDLHNKECVIIKVIPPLRWT